MNCSPRHIISRLLAIRLPAALWVVLWALAFLSVIDIWADLGKYASPCFSKAGLIAFAALKATLLCLMWRLCRDIRRKWLRTAMTALAAAIIAVFALLSLTNAVSYSVYGFGISRKFAAIILQTNPREALEFLPGLAANIGNLLSRRQAWMWLAAIAVIARLMRMIPRKWFNIGAVTLSILGCAYLISYRSAHTWGLTNHSVTLRTAVVLRDTAHWERIMREYLEAMRPLADATTLSSDYAASNVVVVIGESASREHLGLYGYPLNTTPRLGAMRDSLFIFTDALASACTTAENIPRIVTFMSDLDSVSPWYTFPSVVDVFTHLGYSTAWISNQERSGIWSNVSGALSTRADTAVYIGAESSEDHLLARYDEDLLVPLRRFLHSGNNSKHFAVVHLMGSHTEYSRRYPRERSFFDADAENTRPQRPTLPDSKARRVAEYDNSIRYTDSVLYMMIKEIEADTVPAVLVYLSDHGENVYDRGDFCGRDALSVTVPMIIYVNRAYRQRCPMTVNRLSEATSSPLSTSMLPHILMTLTGSHYKAYDAREDVLSNDFIPRNRITTN